jgi:mRNA interferase RelE/StbE
LMSYQIQIERRALKDIESLPAQDRQHIKKAIWELKEDPRPHGCKKLADSVFWRIRVGVYRVVYKIEDERLLVVVIKARHRRDVYR